MRRIAFLTAAAGLSVSAHAQVVVGPGEGGVPVVRLYDPFNPTPPLANLYPAAPNFMGGVRVAVGDVNGDGVQDTITTLGPGGPPEVRVYSGNGNLQIAQFYYGASSPASVGAGDVNGDGFDDVIVGVGIAGHVKVFSGATGAELMSFFAFSPSFTGGVTVAGGDVTGDAFIDVIVAAGPGAPGGHVKAFDGRTGAEIRSFLTFPGFSGGVSVAAGDMNTDGFDDIVVGAGAGAPGGHVKVFDGLTLAAIDSFFAFGPVVGPGIFVGGVSCTDDGVPKIIVGAGPGAPPEVRVFTASGGLLASFMAGDPGFLGGVFVAGFDGGCYPDCTGDGVLTVADFGCFQTKFVGGSPYADCNGDGARTVADFGCFQTKFVQGCP